MNRYFIVDPEAINSNITFNFVLTEFDPWRLRYIYSIPEEWSLKVLNNFSGTERSKKSIRLREFEKKLMPVDNDKTELYSSRNYETLFKVLNVDACILNSYDEGRFKEIIDFKRIDTESENINTPTNIVFNRNFEEFSRIFKPALKLASQIIIVDPYFVPRIWNGDIGSAGVAFLAYFISELKKIKQNNTIPNIYYVTQLGGYVNGSYKKLDNSEVIELFDRHKIKELLGDIKLCVFHAGKKELHNRYLITNVVGFKFGKGFSIKVKECDDVSLIATSDIGKIKTVYSNKKLIDFTRSVEADIVYP